MFVFCWGGGGCGLEAPIDPQGILATRALTAYTPHTDATCTINLAAQILFKSDQ